MCRKRTLLMVLRPGLTSKVESVAAGAPGFLKLHVCVYAHVHTHVHGGRPGEVIPNNKFREVSILQKNKEVQRTEFSLTSDALSLLRV